MSQEDTPELRKRAQLLEQEFAGDRLAVSAHWDRAESMLKTLLEGHTDQNQRQVQSAMLVTEFGLFLLIVLFSAFPYRILWIAAAVTLHLAVIRSLIAGTYTVPLSSQNTTLGLATPAQTPVNRLLQVFSSRRAPESKVDLASDANAPKLELFRAVGRVPDGRECILVFADLLAVLPKRYRYERRQSMWHEVIVEVLAEPAAARELQRMAARLEQDLIASPYMSDAALIGQTSHSLLQMAIEYDYKTNDRTIDQDKTAVAQSDLVRKEELVSQGISRVA